jgi:hypothetical protein
MYLIDIVKRAFFDNQGRLKILPWGFYLVEDLIPLYQMANDLKKKGLTFKDPHQSLGYQTPIEFASNSLYVSKMYSSNTPFFNFQNFCYY